MPIAFVPCSPTQVTEHGLSIIPTETLCTVELASYTKLAMAQQRLAPYYLEVVCTVNHLCLHDGNDAVRDQAPQS
jgi:hypothetical protein